jgi:uncharacterized protein (PEP-CTERM system associated)
MAVITVPRRAIESRMFADAAMKAALLLLLFIPNLASSSDFWTSSWRGNVGVRGSLIFSDNLFLSSTNPESGGVVEVRPFVSSTRNGNRVRVRFNWGPAALWYPGNTELNDVRHVLDASVNTEVIERYFFIDVAAKANQALINPRVNTGFDSIANSNAFTQTASISVTPRIILPVANGRFATLRFSPGVGAVASASTAESNNASRTRVGDQRLNVISGPMFSTVPWSLNLRRQLFSSDTNQGFGSVNARVGYIFSRKYRADLVIGFDDGDYTAANGKSRGGTWELSFRWTPKPSSRFEIGAGQAYYGDLFRFRANHRHKRWALSSSYTVEIQDATTEILQQQIVPLEDLFGEPIVDPITGENVIFASITTPALIQDTFLRDRFQLSVGYNKGRNQATWNWWVTRRDYNSSDLDTLDNQMRLSYTRRLSARLSASADLQLWDHSEQADSGFDYWQDGLNLRVNYSLGHARPLLQESVGRTGIRMRRMARSRKIVSV